MDSFDFQQPILMLKISFRRILNSMSSLFRPSSSSSRTIGKETQGTTETTGTFVSWVPCVPLVSSTRLAPLGTLLQ